MNKRFHNTRLTIRRSINELLGKSLTDRNYPHAADDALRSELYDAWESGLFSAAHDLRGIVTRFGKPERSEINEILAIFKKHLSGKAITQRISGKDPITAAFLSGKSEVDREYKKQTGKVPPIKKDGSLFGILFGLTEQHALDALERITILSAGGFWDDDMSDAVRNILNEFYDGNISRDDVAKTLKTYINAHLSIEGKKSLPRSYFDGLSEHMIVRTRSIGKVYRGKALGATGYRIRNPRDHRTSSICNTLSSNGIIYGMKEAENVVSDILSANSLADLKSTVPFFTSGTTDQTPVPPLHWRCRSWIEMVFAGLNDGKDTEAFRSEAVAILALYFIKNLCSFYAAKTLLYLSRIPTSRNFKRRWPRICL
ncbi:MAG: hypothetical protein ABI778_10515 [Ignavibacteriota bacterium]